MNLALLRLVFLLVFVCALPAFGAPGKTAKSQDQSDAAMTEKDPKYNDCILKAQECLARGRMKLSAQLCSEAIAIDPAPPGAYLFRGISFRRLGQFKKSLVDLDHCISIKKLPMAYLERGTTKLCMLLFQPAIEDFDKCIQIQPKNYRAYGRRAQAYETLGNYPAALKDTNKVIELEPDRQEAYFNRGYVYMGLNEPLRAIVDFDKVLTTHENASARFNKSSCLVQADRPAEAISEYTKVLKLRPRMGQALMNRGRTYILLGKPNEAIVDFTDGLAITPDNELLYLFRGRAYQLKGDLKHAEDDMKQATMRQTDFAVSHYASGVENLLSENPDALRLQTNRKALAPDDTADKLVQNALALQSKKKYDAALKSLNETISLYPNLDSALIARGRLQMTMGKPADALRSYTSAWRRNNLSTEAIHGKIDAFIALGDLVHSLPDINKLIWWDPFFPNNYFLKAEVLRKLKRGPDAVKYYKKYLDLVEKYNDKRLKPFTKYSINQDQLAVAKQQIAALAKNN